MTFYPIRRKRTCRMSSSSYLWTPGSDGAFGRDEQRFEIPEIHLPHHLREDFDANPKQEREFYQAVKRALDVSLRDPRTALRTPTVAAIKERIELCYSAVVEMRMDLHFSFKRCWDLLATRLLDALLKGTKLMDEMERGSDEKFWAGRGRPEESRIGEEVETKEEAFSDSD
jgi:hypothetical protein